MSRQSKGGQKRKLKPAAIAPPGRIPASLWGLLLAVITLLAYLPVWHAGFIFDDDTFLTNNPLIKGSDGLYRLWCTTAAPDYFPLTSTTLWLEWRLWGGQPLGYHLTNVLLHVLSALIVWRVLARLKIPGAWLAAAVFAVHPVNVESVAWITERKNTLAMFFFALTLYGYLKFEDTKQRRWYGLALGSFLLALLSKTAVVPLPLVLPGLAWYRRGKIERRDLWRSLAFFAIAGLLAVVTMWFQARRSIGDEIIRTDGFGSRLAVAGIAVWFYLYKAWLPLNLIFVYPRWQIGATTLVSCVPGAGLLLLLLLCWWQRRKWGRGWLFALGYFILMLLPVLGFINIYYMRYSLVADRWQYFAILGPITMTAAGLTMRWGKTALGVAMGAGILVVLGCLTWRQAQIFADRETLWENTLARNPACWMAHNGLGLAFLDQGRIGAAASQFQEAIRLKPDYAKAHYNLGNALNQEGQTDEAIKQFQEALRFNPDYPEARLNLGTAFGQKGQIDDAIKQFQEALRLQPDSVKAHYNLGTAFGQKDQIEDAIRQFQEVIRLQPDYVMARKNLGLALAAEGKWDEAIQNFEQVLQLQPDSAEDLCNLSDVLEKQGKLDEARRHYQQALNLATAQNNTALAEAIRARIKSLQPAVSQP